MISMARNGLASIELPSSFWFYAVCHAADFFPQKLVGWLLHCSLWLLLLFIKNVLVIYLWINLNPPRVFLNISGRNVPGKMEFYEKNPPHAVEARVLVPTHLLMPGVPWSHVGVSCVLCLVCSPAHAQHGSYPHPGPGPRRNAGTTCFLCSALARRINEMHLRAST